MIRSPILVGAAQPCAYCYGYVRLWKTGAHKNAKIVPIPGFIDLRSTNSVSGSNVVGAGAKLTQAAGNR